MIELTDLQAVSAKYLLERLCSDLQLIQPYFVSPYSHNFSEGKRKKGIFLKQFFEIFWVFKLSVGIDIVPPK